MLFVSKEFLHKSGLICFLTVILFRELLPLIVLFGNS